MLLLPIALVWAFFTGNFIHVAGFIILWCLIMLALEGM